MDEEMEKAIAELRKQDEEEKRKGEQRERRLEIASDCVLGMQIITVIVTIIGIILKLQR